MKTIEKLIDLVENTKPECVIGMVRHGLPTDRNRAIVSDWYPCRG